MGLKVRNEHPNFYFTHPSKKIVPSLMFCDLMEDLFPPWVQLGGNALKVSIPRLAFNTKGLIEEDGLLTN